MYHDIVVGYSADYMFFVSRLFPVLRVWWELGGKGPQVKTTQIPIAIHPTKKRIAQNDKKATRRVLEQISN